MRTVRTGPATGLVATPALLAVLAATVGLGVLGWLVGLACGIGSDLLVNRALASSGKGGLGPADRITVARMILAVGVAALVADGLASSRATTAIVALAVVGLVLDAADGQVARITATQSPFGARLDLEVDAFLILVLSVHAASTIGPWVFAIGAARYALLGAERVLPWLRVPVPPRYWRKVVAAIQGGVLTVAAGDLLPTPAIEAALVASLALLTESFGRDVLWLWRARRPRRKRSAGVAHAGTVSSVLSSGSRSCSPTTSPG